MPRNTRNERSRNGNATPAFKSPDGVRIKINRGGNKMQFVRDLCRNDEITAIQFRILVPLVDTSNEGTDDDHSRWGKSWLSLEKLARESGCSKRAVEKNLPKLEKIGILVVARDLNDEGRPTGGKSHVNEYWLPGWNKFGAISEDMGENEVRSSPADKSGERETTKQRTAAQRTANARPVNSEGCSPDSTSSPNQETQPKDPTKAAPKSCESEPAGGLADDHHPRPNPANDNNEIGSWPDDIVDRFQSLYPKGGDRSKISEALEEIRREGKTEFHDILRGVSNYRRENADTPPKFMAAPENFLMRRLWMGYQRDNRPRPRPSMAI
ncbi:helix-turn-helix domain-containing protein [Bradyrhizobium barranii subsp. apii]|uniref:helix-turn-helix domain-containing protein n=1 Tax=Bradyrhizobium barranii TaxID=2992140 RepID=UPI001AA0B326|nr:helix-turn-helix domain-containing protein [Bradyrhizobium barranii]UPT99424.1 helix-turn-helix domain-containing protein [Bradyrhizobium barranii subsp. apii]